MSKSLKIKNEKCEYKKYTHLEHVLAIPDTYIGSIEQTSEEHWIYDETQNKIEKKLITFIPGQYKLFDELIVNALDQYIRINEKINVYPNLFPVKNIKVDIDEETSQISVYNDGEGIPVTIHPSENVYIPELIFGHLLTSSNYNTDEKKHVGGKNGYGAKLTNIFSKEFTIETVDYNTHKKFIQTFRNNMSEKDKPDVTKCNSKPYTKVTYIPDFARFNETKMGKDIILKLKTRVLDIAANTESNVNVYLNGKKLESKSFEKYIDLIIGDKKITPRAYELVNDRWEIAATLNPNLTFEQISFVNGINTSQGGKHVEYITNQITKKLSEYIQKKKKIEVKANYIRENIIVFIKSTIDDPTFNSQIKETLTTPSSKFGSKCIVSDKFIDKLSKCGIIERAIALTNVKDNNNLKKTDGKKFINIRGIPKLDDANWAGTKKSLDCTLILTEGDSAKATAMAGLSILGRDTHGVFPLKGKLLNVKGEDNNMVKKILENDEINNLKKILGLQTDRTYTTKNGLRYGKVCIFTDQDEDGSHIKGLVMNLFHTLWPSLFEQADFINTILTPIVKAIKKSQTLSFYCVKDYESWRESNNNGKGWKIKYYKGLGTSTPTEAKEYFKKLKLVTYKTDMKEDLDAICLAFNQTKGSSDNRKEWLSKYDRNLTLDYNSKFVSVKDFIDRDLIHFSNTDNIRSIPNIMDGLKPSQRKIIFCCFKRNLKEAIRVAQLSGYVSEHGAYHHGEASLHGTITNMAQDFIGSNNINLLSPIGQFGSRLLGGKDAAQPRYIHTKLETITWDIFDPNDHNLLEYNDDDGILVEPNYYVPIIPMILVNGTSGIGTGWSTNVPCYNPVDIIDNIKKMIQGKPYKELVPWYKDFNGTIEKIDENTFITKGVYSVPKSDILKITELPIGLWTQKYKEFLESITLDSSNKSKKQILRNFKSYNTDTKIDFELHFLEGELGKLIINNNIEKVLKLTSTISTSNMVLFDPNGSIYKYKNVEEILKCYIKHRLIFYDSRKKMLLNMLEKDVSLLEIKIRFIMDFINSKLVINNKRKHEIEEQLKELNYPTNKELMSKYNIVENDDYQYLLKMPIYNLTRDKIEEFQSELAENEKKYKELSNKTINTLWEDDLSKLDSSKKKTLKIK